MKKIKEVKFNKIAALAIIVSVSGSGSSAYALTSSNSESRNTNTSNAQHYKNSINIINKLDGLVTSGSINQFQKASVIKYLVTYKQPIPNPSIDKLSTTGEVSKTDEAIITNLFANYKNSISKAIKDNFSSRLNSLIDLGTITELQKKEIMNLFPTSEASTEGLIDIDTLVTNKIISKNQEITILNSFTYCKKSTSKTINDILLSKLDKLISIGTINGDQRAAVINLAKISNDDSQKLELHRRLDTLVAVGTITKDNETKIINALL
ncbi:hypothetical protein [Clostridium tagluense]|uniref:Uncharacterized protein n=1 Tax=Clostridium tagluense TaxID=360422 RepID=A0A401UPE9_9CLOT|nr:hypothetical protein [Clostridium tagluense]GCD11425.1 hypothetical protein Ctaglu_30480 [Clostridium tagluense]